MSEERKKAQPKPVVKVEPKKRVEPKPVAKVEPKKRVEPKVVVEEGWLELKSLYAQGSAYPIATDVTMSLRLFSTSWKNDSNTSFCSSGLVGRGFCSACSAVGSNPPSNAFGKLNALISAMTGLLNLELAAIISLTTLAPLSLLPKNPETISSML